jgi:hypothetical protein
MICLFGLNPNIERERKKNWFYCVTVVACILDELFNAVNEVWLWNSEEKLVCSTTFFSRKYGPDKIIVLKIRVRHTRRRRRKIGSDKSSNNYVHKIPFEFQIEEVFVAVSSS